MEKWNCGLPESKLYLVCGCMLLILSLQFDLEFNKLRKIHVSSG